MSERRMTGVRAGHVRGQRIGVVGLGSVVSCRAEGDDDQAAASRDANPAQFEVDGGIAVGGAFDGRVMAQELLHRAGHQLRAAAQAPELVGALQQGEDGVAQKIHRALVAGDDQHHAGADQLLLGQSAVLLVAHGYQGGQQIVRRCAPLVGDEAGQQRVQTGQRRAVLGRGDLEHHADFYSSSIRSTSRYRGRTGSGTDGAREGGGAGCIRDSFRRTSCAPHDGPWNGACASVS